MNFVALGIFHLIENGYGGSVCRKSSRANGCKYKYCLRTEILLRRANSWPVGVVFGRAIFASQRLKTLRVFSSSSQATGVA